MVNYYGNTTLEDIVKNGQTVPNYVFIENIDLVFEEELKRIDSLDDTSKNFNNSSYGIILNTSNEFKIYKNAVNKDGNIFNVRFISIDNKYPNSELREYISNGIWYDDYNFIYSVKGRGIFVYNAQDRTYKTLITDVANAEFEIRGIMENKLYYDEDSILEINL